MATNPQVFVHVDDRTFAVDDINYQPADVGGVPQAEVLLPKYQIGGSTIDTMFDHSDQNFINAVEAAVASDANLHYRFDGNTSKQISLETINDKDNPTLRCIYEQLLGHDPIYCEMMRKRKITADQAAADQAAADKAAADQEDTVEVWYMYSTERVLLATPIFENANKEALRDSIVSTGLTTNEANAYQRFVDSNPDAKTVIRTRYVVQTTYDDSGTDPLFRANVEEIREPAIELPDMHIAFPIVKS